MVLTELHPTQQAHGGLIDVALMVVRCIYVASSSVRRQVPAGVGWYEYTTIK